MAASSWLASAGGSAHGRSPELWYLQMNADGSPADEGSFGYGGYATNDAGAAVPRVR